MARFVKGKSGNPAGRKRISTTLAHGMRSIAREHTQEALDTLIELMGPSHEPRTRLTAANHILDRGYGKPVQAIAAAFDAASLTDEQIKDQLPAALAVLGLTDGSKEDIDGDAE